MTSGAAMVTFGRPFVTQVFRNLKTSATMRCQRRRGVGRGRDANHPAVAPKRQGSIAQAEAVHRVDEARRPAAAAKLPVGDARQAERLLEGDDFPDALVLDVFEFNFV